jgi:hypothetical protein
MSYAISSHEVLVKYRRPSAGNAHRLAFTQFINKQHQKGVTNGYLEKYLV